MKGICLLIACLSFFTYSASSHEKNVSLLQLSENQQIEIFVQKPLEETTKLLLFLHGAATNKGLHSISQAWFNHWLSKGYIVAAISLPGYGQTTGVKDFCGPFTMQSLSSAVDYIKRQLGISELGIVGFGQGSTAGLLLTAQRTDIRCIVCSNGGYDLVRHLVAGDALLEILRANYAIEITEEAFKRRSPIEYISFIKTPAFILHREGNPIINESEVLDFVEAMQSAGNECLCSIRRKTPKADVQKLSYEEILLESEEWLDHHMD